MRNCHVLLLIVCSLNFVIQVESGKTRPILTGMSLRNALLSYTCKSSNGLLCNNQGRCVSGRCECHEGTYGDRCEDQLIDAVVQDRRTRFDSVAPVPTETGPEFIACFGNNEGVCNGHGVCINGTCMCEPKWAGITCELQNRVGFCETYRSCAECTALMTKCPDNCARSTKYQLVYDFPISGGTFHRCRYKSSEKDCRFFFQLAGESATGVKTIMVKTCLKYRSTTQVSITDIHSVTSTSAHVTQDSVASVPTETGPEFIACFGNNEGVCNGRGVCINGACMCEPKWAGIICELQNRVGFCETYKSCAECTALMTKCPDNCARSTKYQLVYDFPISGGTFHRCRYTSSEKDCRFFFQLAGESATGVKTIMVKTCLKYMSTTHASITDIHSVTSTSAHVTQEDTSSRTKMTSETVVSTTTTQKDSVLDDKDFCEKHMECAECTALFMMCPSKCARMANYNLVFDFPRIGGESFHRCRFRNSERKCNFYFQLDNSRSSGLKNIMVKACSDYQSTANRPATPKQNSVSLSTTTVEVTTDTDDVTTEGVSEENENQRNQGNEGNVASNVSASAGIYIMCIVNMILFTKYTNIYP